MIKFGLTSKIPYIELNDDIYYDIELECEGYKGTTPGMGDDPTDVSVSRVYGFLEEEGFLSEISNILTSLHMEYLTNEAREYFFENFT